MAQTQAVQVIEAVQTTRVAQGLKPVRPRIITLMPGREIGVPEWSEILAELDRFSRAGAVRFVLDLSDVSHLDYRGVAPLVERAQRAREMGGDLKLSGLSPYLAAIFRVAGAHAAFECFKNPVEAGAAFERALAR